MTKDDLVSKDTALKMAIEFMETLTIDVGIKTWNEKRRKEAIQACKEALEQPKQFLGMKEIPYKDWVLRFYKMPNNLWYTEGINEEWMNEMFESSKSQPAQEPKCSEHPDAPHGFCRDASHSAGRYVCECEGWEAEQQSQEPVAWGNPTYNYAVHHKVAPSWQGLSDDDITKAVLEIPATFPSIFGIARAIEQALRNKNGY